ncbi:MAG: endonuclease III [Candidatus Ancaeobacter aquaticus]|nr:endonuclease III [Candidatus Ancaeobacter aquaticus]
MKIKNIDIVISLLEKEVAKFRLPIVTEFSRKNHDPFKILISTVLSLRTKDETTRDASYRLFKKAATPRRMILLTPREIEKLIYPVGFYKTKARSILHICHTLLNQYKGKVPDTIDDLLTLKGVGRKTANLVVTLGYGKYGICVDTHVHRISNRFGLVKTKNPNETEFTLREILPKKHWIIYNDLLVSYGQNLCRPISPLCSTCPLHKYCNRVGVEKSR